MEFPKIQAAIQGRGQQNSASSFQQFRGEVHGKTSRFINDEKGLLTSRGLCWNKRDNKSSRKSTDVYSNIRWSVIYVWTRLSFFCFFRKCNSLSSLTVIWWPLSSSAERGKDQLPGSCFPSSSVDVVHVSAAAVAPWTPSVLACDPKSSQRPKRLEMWHPATCSVIPPLSWNLGIGID